MFCDGNSRAFVSMVKETTLTHCHSALPTYIRPHVVHRCMQTSVDLVGADNGYGTVGTVTVVVFKRSLSWVILKTWFIDDFS